MAGRKAKSEGQAMTIAVEAPAIGHLQVTIEGISPYVQNAFSNKARTMMRETQEKGDAGKSNKKRTPKDFQEAYQNAMHISKAGWHGIPAAAFRAAMVSACRLCGVNMTLAKLALWIDSDGYDRNDGTALVKITKGKPHYVEHMVRVGFDKPDIRPRPMWDAGWQCKLCVGFDTTVLEAKSAANLLARAGMQVGVGEGRNDSSKSCGMGWGLFKVLS